MNFPLSLDFIVEINLSIFVLFFTEFFRINHDVHEFTSPNYDFEKTENNFDRFLWEVIGTTKLIKNVSQKEAFIHSNYYKRRDLIVTSN